MIGGLLELIILFGIGLVIFFSGLIAHNGHPTKSTWTLLISSGGYLLLVLLLPVTSLPSLQLIVLGRDADKYIFIALLAIFGISLVGIFVGAFLMTSHWRELSWKTADLEKLATQLTAEREDLDPQSHSA